MTAQWLENVDEYAIGIDQIRDLGDRVVLLGEQTARIKGSGVPIRQPMGWVLSRFRDGQFGEAHFFLSWREAFAAGGLSEQAMSQDNAEQARRAADAYNRRDVEAVLQDLDPEIEWHAALPILLGGQGTVSRGHEGVRQLFREIDDVLAEIQVEYSEIRDLGNRVVAIGRIRTRGKASGAETESPIATVSDLRSGKAIRIQSYLDPWKRSRPRGFRDRQGSGRRPAGLATSPS